MDGVADNVCDREQPKKYETRGRSLEFHFTHRHCIKTTVKSTLLSLVDSFGGTHGDHHHQGIRILNSPEKQLMEPHVTHSLPIKFVKTKKWENIDNAKSDWI